MRSLVLFLAGCSPLTGIGVEYDDPRVQGWRDGGTSGLMISEVMDHPTSSYKYVEICNRSLRPIDLSDVTLERYANGNTSPSSFPLEGELASGASLVVVGSGGAPAFELEHGTPPSFVTSIVSGNGDDVYQLVTSEKVVDVFGEVGIDGSGELWEYTDSVVHRLDPVARGADTWSEDEWVFASTADEGTPFRCGDPILDEDPTEPGDEPVEDPDDEDPTDPVDDAPSAPTGTLVISEIMDHADQSSLKYVEICNRAGHTVSLGGVQLQKYTNGSLEPSIVDLSPVLLEPGEAHVIVNPSGADLFATTFGTTADQTSTVASGNGDDAYALVRWGSTLDLYGVIGVDGTDQPWEYKDRTVHRNDGVFLGRPLFESTEWSQATSDQGSPGTCADLLPDPSDPDEDGNCPDADGDGYGSCLDCDDTDPSVHPGAIEACDGVDTDCDGVWLPSDEDADFDGYLDCEVCDEEGLWIPTQNLWGHALKSHLRSFARNQRCGWTSSRRKLLGDIDDENGTVQCVYTDTTAPARNATTTGDINVEHTWPQSLGASFHPAKCDMHHLFPTDMQANSTRSSHPFGEPEPWSVSWEEGGSKLGRRNGEVVFEPPDDHKGNVARALFYMSTTYGLWMDGDYRDLMEDWHALDPVDWEEQDRSQRIAAEQGAVNPFVACPHLLERL